MYPYKILIADDDEAFRSLLVASLEEEGFQASGASSGREAIEKVLLDRPHLIVLDLVMPEIGGHEVCRVIKNDPFLKDIIIIVLSGTRDVDTKLTCFAAGVNDYLVKPVETRELVARIHRFFSMVDEFKNLSPQNATSMVMNEDASSTESDPLEESLGSIDFVASGSTESSARIKPKYGVYRIETLVGSGAMGHVFKAYDEPLERFVAVKILSKKLSNSPAFVERFRREAKVLAAMNHPGIAFIYSFGE